MNSRYRRIFERGTGTIILALLLTLIIVAVGIIAIWWNQYLRDIRGYGFLPIRGNVTWPDRQVELALARLWRVKLNLGGSWPEPKTLAANSSEIQFPENQPYAGYGVYVLCGKKPRLRYLYATRKFLQPSKFDEIQKSLSQKWGIEPYNLLVCVMATREGPKGKYYPYEDYPANLKKFVEPDSWEIWVGIIEGDSSTYVISAKSDIPPVPGCIVRLRRPTYDPDQPNEFYYPEEILPTFKAIYPNAEIPEEQILREGRDY